jgi:phosphoserine aminotransferase
VSTPDIRIPADLLPTDGRFGCGPSKIRPEALAALAASGSTFLGTSHRQNTVKKVVGRVRAGLSQLFSLPDGYEVILGNGGSTVFWDIATFGLVDARAKHYVFGEFSSKFAEATAAAPHLGDPVVVESAPGTRPNLAAAADVDTYCLTHNETSTGVMPIEQVRNDGQLVLVDATSGAGGLPVDVRSADCYYFAPQKCFASDGGLWIAICSPAAVERIEKISASGRWIPASLDLVTALDNSRKDQTYNTPALATIFLLAEQLDWMNVNGGLGFTTARCSESSGVLYDWAEKAPFATPFVTDPAHRSSVVATIDLDGVDASTISAVLRANGVVDTDSYRKLGRNQLRVATFPAIDPNDVRQLTRCIDYVAAALA